MSLPGANRASLAGKVSRSGKLAYTPAGQPVLEFQLAVPQRYFDRESVGNFDVLVVGPAAEEWAPQLRVGCRLDVKGSLWTRTFRDRNGRKVTEIKFLAESIGGYDDEETGRQDGAARRPPSPRGGPGSRPGRPG